MFRDIGPSSGFLISGATEGRAPAWRWQTGSRRVHRGARIGTASQLCCQRPRRTSFLESLASGFASLSHPSAALSVFAFGDRLAFLGTGLSPRFPAYRDWWGRRMARPLGKTTCPCPRTSEPEDHAGRRRHAEAPPGRSGSRVHAPLRPRVHGSAVRGRRTVATTERPPADERINQLVQRVQ